MANSASGAVASKSKPERLPITVSKPTPYTFDLGHLLANDPNPLDGVATSQRRNDALKATARDGIQSLLNQLLTTCPITSSPQGVLLTLPAPATLLPRHKPLPTPKAPTKWELFARKKGIGKYSAKPGAALADKERRKKLVYDEEKGEWVPRWGYKGKNKSEDEWLVEVKEKDWKKEEEAAAQGSSIRGMSRAERKDRIRRNERKMRSNDRASRKSGSGGA
ncbi:hypothetical protein P175DRAFT_0467783 [Aspergillus ochraceoroseus IBT 24754]|uniref:Ribosome biogenesis regulatory protein n=3 Tax=Aspergillus subgen. Nidulantes TaxID=2720870 RepID=A0A0F8WIL6_9EURO|nr:uncharacterized protein P175DRAFT_0467783 [Aspergillus ochraceoroseus IBT 24754]KKK13725.1 ribosome biogenesis protein [Aspergillus ochraceoroseus]KKK17610.1 ribosome biogenesis protein [Aspergillus rambellii]PTU16952.1 hypothetical protein P175DRAFT_0467783 [Aspergillus ochraceoroseus IBT 24754]